MTRTIGLESFIAGLGRGARLYLAGSAGEPVAFTEALAAQPDAELAVTTSFVPGINPLAIDRFGLKLRFNGLFMQASLAEAARTGRYRWLQLSYSGFVNHLRERERIDVCVVQVSPPDAQGRCSLGPSVEFVPEVARISGRLVAMVNPHVRATPLSHAIPVDSFDQIVEIDSGLRQYDVGAIDPVSMGIATRIAAFIEDGATLQVGLGKIPNRLFECLHDRRGLRIHSGMLPDAIIGLAAAGAIAPDTPIVTCNAVGTEALYDWLAARPDVAVVGCEQSHDATRLAALDRFVAVNSALEVDLLGQCNLEFANGRPISGAGGAPDFARGARQSDGGISIVALPSSHAGGTRSRIVHAIAAPGAVSLPRTDVDVIVTEHGVADLRGCSLIERAERIVQVAAPEFRSDLLAAWREFIGFW